MSDELTDAEKIKLAEETFKDFFDMLGPNDVYKKIFLEVFFEEVYGHTCDLTEFFKID